MRITHERCQCRASNNLEAYACTEYLRAGDLDQNSEDMYPKIRVHTRVYTTIRQPDYWNILLACISSGGNFGDWISYV